MKHKLLLLFIIVLLISGCDIDIEKCEEAARIDYNMSNPECHNSWVYTTKDCKCNYKVCGKLSCETRYAREEFDLIE